MEFRITEDSFQTFSTLQMNWSRVYQADIEGTERTEVSIFCGKEIENP